MSQFALLWCAMAPIDLNRLHAFAAVHADGSFSAAAARLGVPRSTVSRAVAALEASLDLRLFARTTRQVKTTAAGLALYDRVAPSLSSLETSLRELPRQEESPAGLLRITTTADLGTVVLAEAVSRYTARYPATQVELHFGPELVDLVKDGFDLALRLTSRPQRSSTLMVRKVGTLFIQLYAAPAYLARRRPPRSPAELRDYDWISFSGSSTMRELVRHRDLREVRARVLCRDPFFAREVLRSGGGVGALPSFLADGDVAAGTLVRVLPRWLVHTGTIQLVQPGGRRHVPRKVTAFSELLLEMLRQRPISTPAS
jgi:DNA-binding transcriptional LysR family regulator